MSRGVDRSPTHLYPPFLAKLQPALQKAAARCKSAFGWSRLDPFAYAETLRTQERQNWLYAQGRTRAGKKVTWIRSPRWHGCGLAADMMFMFHGYNVPHHAWEILREEYLAVGLANPAWGNGDYGHVQTPPSDNAIRSAAAEWVRRGFPPTKVLGTPVDTLPDMDVKVFVNGQLLADAMAFRDGAETWVAIRELADDLQYALPLFDAKEKKILVVQTDWVAPVPAELRADASDQADPTGMDRMERWVPLKMRSVGGKQVGFCHVRDLEPFAKKVLWSGKSSPPTLHIED